MRYKKEFRDLTGDYFHLLLYYFRQGPSGIKQLKGIEESLKAKMKMRLGTHGSGQ
ncbi:MAG: hypothetical protein NTV68_07680 [Methanomicrobiales archaeon]|nr:hypothetical protein [Methanomicrobiales archaeon]